MLSDELKQNLDSWFDKRIRELGNLRKLHPSLIGLKRDEYPAFQEMVDSIIFTYSEIGTTLVEGEGKIECLPRTIKSDIVPYLRRKAEDYPEAEELAEIIMNRVPSCSPAGYVSKPWLKRRGYGKEDLVVKNNITQVGKLRQKKIEESE